MPPVCSPAAVASWYRPRSSTRTRAVSRPAAACGSNASASAPVQPHPASQSSVPGSDRGSVISTDPLELAGPLGVAFGAPEGPDPERDQGDAHHQQRPDVAEEIRDRGAVDQAPAHAVKDIGLSLIHISE